LYEYLNRMKLIITLFLSLFTFSFASIAQNCENFSSAADSSYRLPAVADGATFYSAGGMDLSIHYKDHLMMPGTADSSITIWDKASSGYMASNLNGQIMYMGDANVRMTFPLGASKVVFQTNGVGQQLQVEGDTLITNISGFVGNPALGITMSITPAPGGSGQQFEFTGVIHTIEIGGWELAIDSICYDPAVSINEVNKEEVMLYPNPARHKVQLQFETSEVRNYKLMDVIGQTVLTGELEGNNGSIHINELNNGVYLLNIYKGEELTGYRQLIKR